MSKSMLVIKPSGVIEQGKKLDAYYLPKLIAEVQKQPILWNRYHEHHYTRYLLEKAWDTVAAAMERDKDTVRQRWKSLKDTFKRELRKIKQIDGEEVYTGKWRYFARASFLKETFREIEDVEMSLKNTEHQKTQVVLNLDDLAVIPYNDFDYHFIKEEVEDSEVTCEAIDVQDQTEEASGSSAERKRQASEVSFSDVENEMKKARILAVNQSIELNDDLHFAISIVPYLKKLDPLAKLVVRNKIQTVLLEGLKQ